MKKREEESPAAYTPQDLLVLVEELAVGFRTPVTVRRVALEVAKHWGYTPQEELVQQALCKCPAFAKTNRNRFVTREALLNGARLRIEPDREEIADGILVPGHRFLPLWWGKNTESIQAEDPSGRPIRLISRRMSFADAFPYHYLLGYNWVPDFAGTRPGKALAEEFQFPVFSMARFYKTHRFQPGDFLLVEISDPWEQKVIFHHEPRREALKKVARIRSTEVALERAFLQVLEDPWVLWSLPEQLFHAMARASAAVTAEPCSPFERFLGRASCFSVQEVGLEVAAFPKGTSPFELAARRSRHGTEDTDVFADPVDQLLTRLGVNLHSGSLKGLLRLAAHEGKNLGMALEGIVPWKRLKGADPADMRDFRRCLKKLWAEAQAEEAAEPICEEVAALLRRAASLKQHVLSILRQLDTLGLEAAQLPSRPLLRVVEIDELAECILQLNVANESTFARAAELESLIADVARHLVRLEEEILQQAPVR